MIHFIINPKAKRGKIAKKVKILEKLLHEKKIEYAFHYTTAKGVATDLAREFSKEPDSIVVAVGGDGTVNEVLNGLNQARPCASILSACYIKPHQVEPITDFLRLYTSLIKSGWISP